MNELSKMPVSGTKSSLSDPNRLEALARSGLMDTETEEAFDRAVRLATKVTGRPVAMFSLVDEKRQFFKAHTGLPDDVAEAQQTPISHALCRHVVDTGEALVLNDAGANPMTKDNGAVTDLGVAAYCGVPVRNSKGHVLGSFCALGTSAHDWSEDEVSALQDIAAMVESELQLREVAHDNAMLMGELTHRIKNIFTVTSSLVRMTARSSTSVEDMATTLSNRMTALDAAQSLALSPKNGGPADHVDLATLLERIMGPYNSAQIKVSQGELVLTPQAATAFALIFHELATNAMKYGALSDADGTLEISSTIDHETLVVLWRETRTIGTVDTSETARHDGFGTQLIDANLRFELGGVMTRHFTDDGMNIEMRIPLNAIRP